MIIFKQWKLIYISLQTLKLKNLILGKIHSHDLANNLILFITPSNKYIIIISTPIAGILKFHPFYISVYINIDYFLSLNIVTSYFSAKFFTIII